MGSEKRSEDRQSIEDGVLYLHELKSMGNTAQNGLVFDISKGGACIYTQQEFHENDIIKVFSSKIGSAPRKATIRWCKKMDENLFKVGLSFNGTIPETS